MNIQIAIYDSIQNRLDAIQYLLATLANQGISTTVVHPGITAGKKLAQALGLPVIGGYDLPFAPVDSNSILVVDADLLRHQHLKRLEALNKDLYVLVPPGVLPDKPKSNALRDVLKPTGRVFPEMFAEVLPRTFGCHHMADSCSMCESSVLEFMADRRVCQ